jgi:hypothetical protein
LTCLIVFLRDQVGLGAVAHLMKAVGRILDVTSSAGNAELLGRNRNDARQLGGLLANQRHVMRDLALIVLVLGMLGHIHIGIGRHDGEGIVGLIEIGFALLLFRLIPEHFDDAVFR